MKQELTKALAQLWVGSASVEINPERNGNPLDDRYALVVAGVEVDKFTSYTSAAEHLISLSNNPPVEIIELSRNDTIRIRSLALNYGKGLPVGQQPQTCKVKLESSDNNGKPIYFVLDGVNNQVNVCSFLIDNEGLNKRCIECFPLSVLDGEIIQVGDISLVLDNSGDTKKEVVDVLLKCMGNYQDDIISMTIKVKEHAEKHGNDMPESFEDLFMYFFDIDKEELDVFYRWLILKEEDF